MGVFRHLRSGRHAMTAFLLIWLLCLLYFLAALSSRSNEAEAALRARLDEKDDVQRKLEKENMELRELLEQLQAKLTERDDQRAAAPEAVFAPPAVQPPAEGEDLDVRLNRVVNGPSSEYEEARRRVRRDLKELWWFVRSRLDSAANDKETPAVVATGLREAIAGAKERQQAVLADLERLRRADGYDSWRRKASASGECQCSSLSLNSSFIPHGFDVL